MRTFTPDQYTRMNAMWRVRKKFKGKFKRDLDEIDPSHDESEFSEDEDDANGVRRKFPDVFDTSFDPHAASTFNDDD
jgi:hypothetical protein